jgi:hypothetical protein
MNALPVDLVHKAFYFLNFKEIMRCNEVNRRIREAVQGFGYGLQGMLREDISRLDGKLRIGERGVDEVRLLFYNVYLPSAKGIQHRPLDGTTKGEIPFPESVQVIKCAQDRIAGIYLRILVGDILCAVPNWKPNWKDVPLQMFQRSITNAEETHKEFWAADTSMEGQERGVVRMLAISSAQRDAV